MVYTDSRLKIDRAKKHIGDIELRVAKLLESNVATVEINPKLGNEVIRHDLTDNTATTDLALMIGDAIHNLKSALDYAWLQTIERLAPSAAGKFAKFPVYPSRDALENALKGRKIDKSSPALFALMLDCIRPYEGGHDVISEIHELNIRDKHRLLLPIIHYSSIDGIETEDALGNVSSSGYTMGTTQVPPWYISMPVGFKVRKMGKVSLNVMFGEGGDPSMRYTDTLYFFPVYVMDIIERLEAMQ